MKQKLLAFGSVLAVIAIVLASNQRARSLVFQTVDPKTGSPSQDREDSEYKDLVVGKSSEEVAALPGNMMIMQASRNLQSSPPLVSNARFHAEMFGVQINGPGKIMLKGQGSGQSRMEFVFKVDQEEQRLIQVSDNEYFYFIRQAGERRLVESIDLAKLSEARKLDANTLLSGSLSSLLERLHDLFVFERPREEKLGQLDVFRLRGHWRERSLMRLLQDPNDTGELGESPKTNIELPDHVPQVVEVIIARGGTLPLFPYRIEFKRENSQSEGDASIVSLELFDVQPVREIPDAMFQVHTGFDRPTDRTSFYIERINRLRR